MNAAVALAGLGRPVAALRRWLDQWLFRVRAAETSPIVLVQRRVFVLPTRAGLAYGANVILLLIGSINYVLSLGYVLTFLLAGLGVVCILHTFRNLAHLRIEAGRCDPVYAGQPPNYELVLTNARMLPRHGLRLHLKDGPVTGVDIPADDAVTIAIAAAPAHRGWNRLGRVTLETTAPLGLVRAWSYIEPDMRCLAYPAPEPNPPPLPESAEDRAGSRASAGGADDFSGLRAYQPSDSPRHIAWKSVAREAELLTKQFAGGATGTLWLDWQRLPSRLDVEARLSRLAAYVLQAGRAGLSFGLRLPGRSVAPGTGSAHVEACLTALALHGIADD